MINFKNAAKVQFITEWHFTKKGDNYYLLFIRKIWSFKNDVLS